MTQPTPTGRELEALKVLWREGEATVRQIWTELSQADGQLAYTTVLTLMQVMEQKGLVRHRLFGKAYVYCPQVGRDSTFRSLAGSFLDKVFDGEMSEYLVHALQSRRITLEELNELEKMIAQAKNRTSKRGKKGGKQ